MVHQQGSHKEVWKKIILALASIIPGNQIMTWFVRTISLGSEQETLRIGVPTAFSKNWIEKHYAEKILEAARPLFPEPLSHAEFIIDGTLNNGEHGGALAESELRALLSDFSKKTRKLPNRNEIKISQNGENGPKHFLSNAFNPKYSLDSFIVGKDNRLAHAACMAVGNRPGSDYNPLFVYGGVGLGKTHLLQATGLQILKNFPEKTVVYMTSEQFMNEIVAAIQKYQAREFKMKYRSVDCFIVDDIQFIAERDRTQEEFFHTFNELYQNGKQIILSSDRPPRDLAGIDERLKSRFGSGMVVEVYFPDFETRLAILQRKCQEQGVILPNEVLELIAHNARESIRELEGMLTQAVAETKLEDSTPTIRSVGARMKQLNKNGNLVGITEEEVTRQLKVRTPEDMIQLVSSYYRIPSHEIIGVVRKKEVLIPRQIAMYLIYENMGYSLDSIGHYFGGKNHTTVLHGVKKVKMRLGVDRKLVADVHALKKEMGL